MDEKSQFFRYIAELRSENPNIDELNEAKSFVFNLDRIPLLFSIFQHGTEKEIFYAKIVLTKIMKPKYPLTSNQQTFHIYICSLSDQDYDLLIQNCVALMNTSDELCVFFSKVICKSSTFSYRTRYSEYIEIFNQKLRDFIERLYSTKNRQFIKPASQLFKRVLKFSLSIHEESQESYYSYLNEMMVQVITGELINLELAASFVQAYCKTQFTGALFLFDGENRYCDVFSNIALFSRELFQEYAQYPFFLEFLEINFSFLYKFLIRPSNFQHIPYIQDVYIPQLIPAAVEFILFITQVYPQNPIVEKIVYHLIPLVNKYLIKAKSAFQDNIELLHGLIDVAYTFSCPSQDEISDFPENYRNYYVSVFSDHRTPFVSAISIIVQICKTLNVHAIRYVCHLLQEKPGENSIFVISRIYPFLVHNLPHDSEVAHDILEFLTVYCNQFLPMLNDASIPDRVKYTIFWMIGECITAFQIDPIVEIIGGLLQSLVQIQPDGSKQLAVPDPLIMIKFSFASDIALALFENFPGIQLPEEAITLFFICHNTTFSTSSLKLLQNLISILPNEKMQAAILPECIDYLDDYFSPGGEKDSLETAFANDRFSLIQFISSDYLESFPTESFIELINKHLESLLDEIYLTSVLSIVTNIIKNQPHPEIALEFAITNGNTASFSAFRKELANVYYQSFISIPADVLNNYIPQIYLQLICIIRETMLSELTAAVQNNSYNNVQDYFIDYTADLNVLSRLIQLQRASLPPETLQEIWTLLLQFWNCQFNQERKQIVEISFHISLSFYDVMGALCLCTSFDPTLVKDYLNGLKDLILLGFFSTFYYRRLFYSVLMILIRHQEFQDLIQLKNILVQGSVQRDSEVDAFLQQFPYFDVDADILAPVELQRNFPPELQPNIDGDQNIDETQ